MPDIQRSTSDPNPSTSIDTLNSAPGDCPAGTFYLGFKIKITDVKDALGTSVEPTYSISDFVQVVSDQEIHCLVTDSSLDGTYTVEFVAGLPDETDAEILTR